MTQHAELQAQGTPGLRRVLGGIEYFTLALGSMVGVGWVVLMHDWLKRGGPVGAAVAFAVGGFLLVPIGVVYGHLTARIPQADSEIAYTASLFPLWGRFAIGWMMTLGYLIVCPFEAVAIGQLAAQMVPGLQQLPLYHVGHDTVYLPELVLGLGLIIVITGINLRGVQQSAVLQNAFTLGLLAVFAIFATLGLARGSARNLTPAFARDGSWGAVLSTLAVLQIIPYFMAGFESVSRCAEERHVQFREGRFVAVTLAAIGVGVIFYCMTILVVALLYPWQELARTNFATLIAFRRGFGSEWLVNLIWLGAILSLVKVFNGNFLSASRLLFAMGRARMVSGRLAEVHDRFHTPGWSIIAVGALSALGCFWGKQVLVPITDVGSFAIAVGWLGACIAYAAGVGARPRWQRALFGVGGSLVAALALSMKLVPLFPESFTRAEYLALGGWVALGIVFWMLRPKDRYSRNSAKDGIEILTKCT
jgi:APA family basic amino acid/polyamine antiporter